MVSSNSDFEEHGRLHADVTLSLSLNSTPHRQCPSAFTCSKHICQAVAGARCVFARHEQDMAVCDANAMLLGFPVKALDKNFVIDFKAVYYMQV